MQKKMQYGSNLSLGRHGSLFSFNVVLVQNNILAQLQTHLPWPVHVKS